MGSPASARQTCDRASDMLYMYAGHVNHAIFWTNLCSHKVRGSHSTPPLYVDLPSAAPALQAGGKGVNRCTVI